MAKGKKGAKTRVGWQSPKNMMHNFMIIVFNQRMIQAYMEELMIKLATLLKNIIMHHVLWALPPYSYFGTLLSLCHPLTRIFCIFVTYFTRGNFFIKKLPTHISFKASLILMAFSYLKSVAYIRDGILIKKL